MKRLMIIIAVAAVVTLFQLHLYAQEGASEEELELLREAWARHRNEKQVLEATNPVTLILGVIEGEMRDAHRGLSDSSTGEETQKRQKTVMRLLDSLIKASTAIEEPGNPADNPPGAKPGEESGEETPGSVDLIPVVFPSGARRPAVPASVPKKKLLENAREKELRFALTGKPGGWDARLRRRMRLRDLREGANEKRPPKYESLIDEYFRRLAEGLLHN